MTTTFQAENNTRPAGYSAVKEGLLYPATAAVDEAETLRGRRADRYSTESAIYAANDASAHPLPDEHIGDIIDHLYGDNPLTDELERHAEVGRRQSQPTPRGVDLLAHYLAYLLLKGVDYRIAFAALQGENALLRVPLSDEQLRRMVEALYPAARKRGRP